jgi:hypothetical protein
MFGAHHRLNFPKVFSFRRQAVPIQGKHISLEHIDIEWFLLPFDKAIR